MRAALGQLVRRIGQVVTLKVVVDTNVMVSALVWRGNPRRLLDQGLAAGWQFFTSAPLLAELERVLAYPRIADAIVRKGQTFAALFEAVG